MTDVGHERWLGVCVLRYIILFLTPLGEDPLAEPHCSSPSLLKRQTNQCISLRLPFEASVVCFCCPATGIGTFLGGPAWTLVAVQDGDATEASG